MRIRTIAFLLLAGIGVSQAQIPRLISYQGIYTDTLGVPKPDSTYSFTFKLYNTSSGGTALWTETKTLPVRKGLFFTNLGDVTPLSLPFDAPYWLGVQVGANPELSPRTQLTASGYSLRAVKADTAAYAGGAVLNLPFAGTVSSTIPAFSITNSGGGRTAHFKNDNPFTLFTPTVHIETRGFSNGLFSYIDTAANVGSAVLGQTNGNGQGVTGNASNTSGSGTGVLGIARGTGKGVYGTSSGSGSAVEGVNTGTGWAGRFEIDNTSSTRDAVSITTNGNGNGIFVGVTGNGNGIVSIAGNSSSSANAIHGIASGSGFGVYGLSVGTGGGVRGEVTSGSLPAIYGTAAGPGHAVQGTSTGTGSAGRFFVTNTSSPADAVYAQTMGTGSAAYFETVNASSTAPALQVSTPGGAGIAGSFNGRVKVNVLEILGGSDLAEPFESAHEEVIEPGTVMVIDDENPGKLKPSSTPYDPKVAGIVSGAGGVKPGLMLKQEGMLEGKTNVAIAGRVYCKVDATSLPVEPGDLLTTSTLPGHAMKAADRDRANGAIIGKAMSRLDTGTGLVLVLVNLQ